jgi:hypothetical protein
LNGTTWTIYNTGNSGLPHDNVLVVRIDSNGDKWIGTTYGLARLHNYNEWENYDTYNSGLPENYIRCLAIDANDTKWIGSGCCGFTKFNENGIPLLVKESKNQPALIIYPNPASERITVDLSAINQLPFSVSTCEITTLQGTTVLRTSLTGQSSTLDLSKLSPGPYIISCNNANGRQITGKVIIR